jgi:ABC-type dipeptide/oligopeptide/nickel transport system permease subunit
MKALIRTIPLCLIAACGLVGEGGMSQPWLDPSGHQLLGTDEFGRNILAVLLTAAGRSLVFGMVLAFTVSGLALLIAYVLAFRLSRVARSAAMATTQIVESVPVVIWVLAAFAATSADSKAVVGTIFTIAILPFAISIMTGEMMRLRGRPYVEAARLGGTHGIRLLRWHLLPNALEVLMPLIIQIAGLAIMIEGAIGFLGFTNRTDTDLGVLLLRGRENVTTHPVLLISTLAVFAAIFASLFVALGGTQRLLVGGAASLEARRPERVHPRRDG